MNEAHGMFKAIQAAVRKLPKGRVATYGEVARAAGYPGAARQVVWALRAAGKGSLPWHRVLAAKGRIALPGENGFEQRLRLRAEGVGFVGDRVDMARFEFIFRNPRTRKQRAKEPAARRKNQRQRN